MGRFRHEQKDQTLIISMPTSLDQTAADEFSEISKAWLLSPVTSFTFDFTGVLQISQPFYRAMVQIRDILKKAEKNHTSIGLSETLLRQIRADGVEPAFHGHPQPAAAPARAKVDLVFVGAFLNATLNTFLVQCQIKVKVGKPYIKKDPLQNVAVASHLALASEGFKGRAVLSFPENVFLQVYAQLIGEEHAKLNSEMAEAASELLNIIYGIAKSELNQKGFNFAPTLPTVLSASAFQSHQTGKVHSTVIPFEMDAGTFHLEIESATETKR